MAIKEYQMIESDFPSKYQHAYDLIQQRNLKREVLNLLSKEEMTPELQLIEKLYNALLEKDEVILEKDQLLEQTKESLELEKQFRVTAEKSQVYLKKELQNISTCPLTGFIAQNAFMAKEDVFCEGKMFIMLDVNFLKEVNDNYGHDAGNRFLQGFGSAVRNNLRKQDIVIRYGGDEVLILLDKFEAIKKVVKRSNPREGLAEYVTKYVPKPGHRKDFVRACKIMARLMHSINNTFVEVAPNVRKRLSASVGFSTESIDIADANMYENKFTRKAVRQTKAIVSIKQDSLLTKVKRCVHSKK